MEKIDVEKLEAELYEVKDGKLPHRFVEFLLSWLNDHEERLSKLESK